MKNKIAIILGTRPEAIKLIPIYLELKKSELFEPVLISTGQHESMLNQIFSFFDVEADMNLNVMQPNQSLTSLTSVLLEKISNVFETNTFDMVLVQGDTTTAFVGALCAHYFHIKIAHVEAGLRTYNKWAPFPEESNRKMISVLADIHFTPTKLATRALEKENVLSNVVEVGNSVIDSLFLTQKIIRRRSEYYRKKFSDLLIENRKVILVTGHRRESFGKGFEEICNALANIAENNPNLLLIYPVHMNPNVHSVVHKTLSFYKNIHLINPLPYDELVYIMQNSWLIMTDSGGIQEEAPSVNVPVIVMRETTERQEGIDAGCCILAGTTTRSILKQFRKIQKSDEIYKKMSLSQNPYGDGETSKRIVKHISNFFDYKSSVL